MNTSKPIQIFKPGKHVAASGAALSFSEADLAATAAAYDPAKHEAPIVIGHPQHNTPAYGWVGQLAFSEGGLEANPTQVNPDFAEMVTKGVFKKVSASFYSPDSPNNPVPGVFYLRHVGFLGAQPPAVKGLRSPEFSDAEVGIVEFADWDDVVNASVLRSIREWIISKFGMDDADKAIPGYAVSQLEASAQQEADDEDTPSGVSYSEKPKPIGDEMSAEEKAELARLKAENENLRTEQVAFAEAEKKRKTVAITAENLAFAEGLIKDGKLLPAEKDVTVAVLNSLAAQEQVVEFGEGDAKKPLLEAHKAKLLASPKLVEFSELAGGKGATGDVEKDPTAIAAAAVEFQESEAAAGRVVNSAQAVQHVMAKAGA